MIEIVSIFTKRGERFYLRDTEMDYWRGKTAANAWTRVPRFRLEFKTELEAAAELQSIEKVSEQ